LPAPSNQPTPPKTKHLIDKLQLEKIPFVGIAPVVGVSERWWQNHANPKYNTTPKQVDITKKQPERLTIQCDQMWSFVGSRHNKPWI
jgi:hypothetical protein